MSGTKPDERIRTPMRWDGRRPGPASRAARPGSPQLGSRSTDVATEAADPDSLLSAYRALTRLRTANPALRGASCSRSRPPTPRSSPSSAERRRDDPRGGQPRPAAGGRAGPRPRGRAAVRHSGRDSSLHGPIRGHRTHRHGTPVASKAMSPSRSWVHVRRSSSTSALRDWSSVARSRPDAARGAAGRDGRRRDRSHRPARPRSSSRRHSSSSGGSSTSSGPFSAAFRSSAATTDPFVADHRPRRSRRLSWAS